MEEQVMNLSVHPQILDLYTVLEQNGLSKQKEEIQSLVSYIENMENKLSEMSEEIENMHKALAVSYTHLDVYKRQFLTLAGGVVITFAKEILSLITGG